MGTVKSNLRYAYKHLMLFFRYFLEAMFCIAGIIFWAVVNFMNGKIGQRRIKRPYIKVWKVITWGTCMILVLTYVVAPIMNWWSKVIMFVQYVIWG